MMDKQPERRPATAYDVEEALIPFCRPGTIPVPATPVVVEMAAPAPGADIAEAVPLAIAVSEPISGWGIDPATFTIVQAAADSKPRKRELSQSDRTRTRLLLILGAILHLTGISLLLAWAFGAFSSTPESDNTPPVEKKDDSIKKGKSKKQNPPS